MKQPKVHAPLVFRLFLSLLTLLTFTTCIRAEPVEFTLTLQKNWHSSPEGPLPEGLQPNLPEPHVTTMHFILSCPRRLASSPQKPAWIPAFAGMTKGRIGPGMQR